MKAAIPLVKPRQAGFVSAGYDALEDTISVLGTTPEELVRAIEEVAPGAGAIALASISAGTLRIVP